MIIANFFCGCVLGDTQYSYPRQQNLMEPYLLHVSYTQVWQTLVLLSVYDEYVIYRNMLEQQIKIMAT